MTWALIRQGEPVSLNECPPGPFEFKGHLGYRSEYATTLENPRRYQVDAYCFESGEYFWGGASGTEARGKLIVQPLTLAATPKPPAGGDAGAADRLARIRTSMALLQQNSEGCALNHYGNDGEQFGMPGWLIDTKADLDAFTDHLAALALPAPAVEGERKLLDEAIEHIGLLVSVDPGAKADAVFAAARAWFARQDAALSEGRSHG